MKISSPLRASTGLFKNSPEASASYVEARKDVTFHSDVSAARGNAASRCDPQPTSSVVNLVSALTEYAVRVRNSSSYAHLLVTVSGRVCHYLGDGCLLRAGR